MNNQNNLPNFLIIGAARSGTTSLYHYLREHPEVFLPEHKEPKFITSTFLKFPFIGKGDQKSESNIIKNFNNYKKLYNKVTDETVIGEASTDTLYYHKQAPKKIKKYLGNPKIIIILRNPTERAYSAYWFLKGCDREKKSNFKEALKAEGQRIKQPRDFIWYYKDVGLYYKQVKSYLENFDQVKIYLFKELKENPKKLIKDAYKFLDIDPSFIPKLITKHNASGKHRSKIIHNLLNKPNIFKKTIKKIVKTLHLFPNQLKKISLKLSNNNLKKGKINEEDKKYLKNYYKKDIKKLEELINKDLSHWLK